MIPFLLAAVGGYLIGQSRRDEQYAKGGMADGGGVGYENWQMVVVSKELQKDGGRYHKDRFLVSARNIEEAKEIATKLWNKEFGDTDLSIVNVMSESLYRLKYIDQYADGGMMAKGGGVYSLDYFKNKLEELDPDGNTIVEYDEEKNEWYWEDYKNDVYKDGFESEYEAYDSLLGHLENYYAKGGYMAKGGMTATKYQIAQKYWKEIEESMTPKQKAIYKKEYKRLESKFDQFDDSDIANYIQGSINEYYDDSFKLTKYEISGQNWFKLGYKYIAHNDAIHHQDWYEEMLSTKASQLLKDLEIAYKNKDEDKFDKISDEIHDISDNEGLTEEEYNKWDEIRHKDNERRIDEKFAKGGMMAKGGVLEHGLRKGDKIVSEMYNIAGVINEDSGEAALVDIETGKREEIK